MVSEIQLVPPTQTEVGIFGGLSYVQVVTEAVAVAKALAPVLEGLDGRRPLFAQIGDRRHVMVEGWTLLGVMMRVYPVTAWTRPVSDGDGSWATPQLETVEETLHSKWCHNGGKGHKQSENCETYKKERRRIVGPGRGGWEARVEVRTANGDVVGAAEAECRWDEVDWGDRDSYAVRSMAATRATSKALRQPLGFIVELAGFSATPAEEMGKVEDITPPFDSAAFAKDAVQQFARWSEKERADAFKRHGKELFGGKPSSADEVKTVIDAMAVDYYAAFPDDPAAPFGGTTGPAADA